MIREDYDVAVPAAPPSDRPDGIAFLLAQLGHHATTLFAEQVAKMRRILEELGHSIATPAEARDILALKGGDNVGF